MNMADQVFGSINWLNQLRRVAIVGMGFGITVALFVVMYRVVAQDEVLELLPPNPTPTLEIVRLPPPVTTPPPPAVQPPPEVLQPPRIPQIELTGEGFTPIGTTIEPPRAGPARPALMADGDLARVLAIAPDYPRRPLAQGIEGWVLVEFGVDEMGRVVHPQVIDASPATVFNAAAIKAILRYKYRPRVVNGQAVVVSGVRQRIQFQLQ